MDVEDDRRGRNRSVPRPAQPAARVSRLVKGGAVGLAVIATARWLLRNPPGRNPTDPIEEPKSDPT